MGNRYVNAGSCFKREASVAAGSPAKSKHGTESQKNKKRAHRHQLELNVGARQDHAGNSGEGGKEKDERKVVIVMIQPFVWRSKSPSAPCLEPAPCTSSPSKHEGEGGRERARERATDPACLGGASGGCGASLC